jgi:hypothetical protein
MEQGKARCESDGADQRYQTPVAHKCEDSGRFRHGLTTPDGKDSIPQPVFLQLIAC